MFKKLNRSHEKGFTLIELMVVITILALFAMGNFADGVRGEDVWKW